MNQDDLKKYSVKVNNGSGCIFQPMTEEYLYILTAKHLFFEKKEDDRGIESNVEALDGTIINIVAQEQNIDTWTERDIPFTLVKGETYFPHKLADIAILKLTPSIKGFEHIITIESFIHENGFKLCGFPNSFIENTQGDRWTSFIIENFTASGNYSYGAQLFGTLRQENIEGLSGCGILKEMDDYISIIGIHSKMASSMFPVGQIGFVPIKYAYEIIEYAEYVGKLSKLLPVHLKSFDFLRAESFLLEVDEIDEINILATRTTLRNKALSIIQSDITPYGIRELFKERLLISENDCECLSQKMIWIAWLEFLTIMNIVKYEIIDSKILSEIFNSYRLKFANVDDWTGLFRTDLLQSDYIGLQPDSTVIVSTRKPPKRNYLIPKGKMINILNVYDKKGFKTNKGIDPYTSFNFVHLDYFKTECVLDKLEQYQNMNEEQLLEKLRQEYNGLFN